MSLDVSIVVPVYGGQATLPALCERVDATMAAKGWRWELLLVCDRPRDDSWAVARHLATNNSHVRALLLRRNVGQHPATLLGIRLARGQVVVTMDEDLQHAPEDIPALVQACRDKGGIAYGVSRELQHGVFRNASSRLIKWFLRKYLGVRDAQHLSAFRAFPVQARQAFADYRGLRVAIDVLLSWSGLPALAVPCQHAERQGGKSGYTLGKLVAHLADLAFGFSVAPLRVASYLGILAMLVAFAIAAYALVNWWLHGSAVPGFAFLAMAVGLLSGAQLLALGIIGEYLGRLYSDNLRRPQYQVAESVGQSALVPDPASEGALP